MRSKGFRVFAVISRNGCKYYTAYASLTSGTSCTHAIHCPSQRTHSARCSQQILTCMNVTRYLSLSYSTRNPFMMNTKKERRRSRAFSLYYYYFLLLFLHSFIALYQLTKAPSSFSSHPLTPSLFRVLPFRLAPLHLLCSRLYFSSFQRRRESW